MKKFVLSLLFLFALLTSNVWPILPAAHAELTKQDVAEIRAIVKEELQEELAHVHRRIDDLQRFMLWGFGVTFSGMFTLVAFVLWDRRTAIAPVQRVVVDQERDIAALKGKEEALEKKEQLIESVLRDYAILDPRMGEALRRVGLA